MTAKAEFDVKKRRKGGHHQRASDGQSSHQDHRRKALVTRSEGKDVIVESYVTTEAVNKTIHGRCCAKSKNGPERGTSGSILAHFVRNPRAFQRRLQEMDEAPKISQIGWKNSFTGGQTQQAKARNSRDRQCKSTRTPCPSSRPRERHREPSSRNLQDLAPRPTTNKAKRQHRASLPGISILNSIDEKIELRPTAHPVSRRPKKSFVCRAQVDQKQAPFWKSKDSRGSSDCRSRSS